MIAVGAVLFVLLGGTESGKADAGAAARTDVARQIYRDVRDAGTRQARRIATDVPFATALRRGDVEALQTRATDLLARRGVQRIVVREGRQPGAGRRRQRRARTSPGASR